MQVVTQKRFDILMVAHIVALCRLLFERECVCERERECVCVRGRACVSVCVCVCARESEGERV